MNAKSKSFSHGNGERRSMRSRGWEDALAGRPPALRHDESYMTSYRRGLERARGVKR